MFGLWFHDAREFPLTHGLTWDVLAMGSIAAALLVAVWRMPAATWPAAALAAFGLVMLVGGALSVLPLPIVPFVPQQTVYHYVSHAVYALAQLPLIALCLWRWRRRTAGAI
jgi:hypothetical protein